MVTTDLNGNSLSVSGIQAMKSFGKSVTWKKGKQKDPLGIRIVCHKRMSLNADLANEDHVVSQRGT